MVIIPPVVPPLPIEKQNEVLFGGEERRFEIMVPGGGGDVADEHFRQSGGATGAGGLHAFAHAVRP